MTPLAAILAKRGISQYELRRRTRLSPQTIASAYHGRAVPTMRTRVKIVKALDVSLRVLDPVAAADVDRPSIGRVGNATPRWRGSD